MVSALNPVEDGSWNVRLPSSRASILNVYGWMQENFPKTMQGKHCADELTTLRGSSWKLITFDPKPGTFYRSGSLVDPLFDLEYDRKRKLWRWPRSTMDIISALHQWHSVVLGPELSPIRTSVNNKTHNWTGALPHIHKLPTVESMLSMNLLPSLRRVGNKGNTQDAVWSLGVQHMLFSVHHVDFVKEEIFIKPSISSQRKILASNPCAQASQCPCCCKPAFRVKIDATTLTPDLGPDYFDRTMLFAHRDRVLVASTLWSNLPPISLDDDDHLVIFANAINLRGAEAPTIKEQAKRIVTKLHVTSKERYVSVDVMSNARDAWPGRHEWIFVPFVAPFKVRQMGPLLVNSDVRNQVLLSLSNDEPLTVPFSEDLDVRVFSRNGLIFAVAAEVGLAGLLMEAFPEGIGCPVGLSFSSNLQIAHPCGVGLCAAGHPSLRSLCCTPVAEFPPGFDITGPCDTAFHATELGMIHRALLIHNEPELIEMTLKQAMMWKDRTSLKCPVIEPCGRFTAAMSTLHPGWPYMNYTDLFMFGRSAVRTHERDPRLFTVHDGRWRYVEPLTHIDRAVSPIWVQTSRRLEKEDTKAPRRPKKRRDPPSSPLVTPLFAHEGKSPHSDPCDTFFCDTDVDVALLDAIMTIDQGLKLDVEISEYINSVDASSLDTVRAMMLCWVKERISGERK